MKTNIKSSSGLSNGCHFSTLFVAYAGRVSVPLKKSVPDALPDVGDRLFHLILSIGMLIYHHSQFTHGKVEAPGLFMWANKDFITVILTKTSTLNLSHYKQQKFNYIYFELCIKIGTFHRIILDMNCFHSCVLR